MKKNSKGEFRPSAHTRSNTHGFSVIPNPYENRWDHIPVKETTQRLINISKNHRKRNKQKLCFSTSTRSIPMRAVHKPPSSRPSSAPAVTLESFPQNKTNLQPTPPGGSKTNYATRKIRSAVPRVNLPDKPPEPSPSPAFDLVRTENSLEMKVQIEDAETKERLAVVEAEKRELEEEIKRLKLHIEDLEAKFDFQEKTNKEKQQIMQIEFNRNLAATLNEKKKDLRRVKEMHYAEISALKHKMNDGLKMQRNESSFLIAKLKGEIDSNRESHKYSVEKLKMEHSEQIQDLQSDLFLKHQSEKTKLLRDLEERLMKEKELALQTLKSKLEADLNLLKQQHTQELEEVLHTFEGISIEEVDSNRNTIQDQELQLLHYKRSQKKLEEEMRSMMNELASHKTAFKQLQESFFDKVNEVDAKYTQQLSSLLIDNKDLRKRYLNKCDELFTLKAAFNRLQEAKGYIAKEWLSAIMQGKQPHVITSSAVKANWSRDGLGSSRRCSSVGRSISEGQGIRSQSACSVEDPAALMLSTCSYIQDNSGCTRNPRPLSETIFSRDDFPFSQLSHASSDDNLSTLSERPAARPVGRISRVRSTNSDSEDLPHHRKQRPVSSVCVVRPHSRQALEATSKPRATSADPRSRLMPGVMGSEQAPDNFNLPALPLSPKTTVKRNDPFTEPDPLFLEYER